MLAHAQNVAVRVHDREALRALAIESVFSTRYDGFDWLELEPAQFERLRAAGIDADVVEDATRVRFGRIGFDPLSQLAPDAGSTFPVTDKHYGLRLVQMHGPLKAEWLAELAARGIEVLQYYPHNTVLVWAPNDVAERAEAVPFVRWQGPFVSAWKMDDDLVARDGMIRNVDVHFYNDGNTDAVLAQLTAAGARILRHAPAQPDRKFFDAWIEIDRAALERIALIAQVVWFGYASPKPVLEDEMAAQILAGNYSAANVPQTGYVPWLAGIDYSGSGVNWAVIDSGVDLSHPDLAPNILGGFSYPGCSTTGGNDFAGGGHGTHVAGIIAGLAIGDGVNAAADAAGFRYGQGVAPGTKIYSFSTVDCGASWPPAGGWQELSKRGVAANTQGANASWTTGEGIAHGYKASERTFDLMIRDGNFDTPVAEPYIFVFSAGNSGPNATTLTSPKEAKNPIIVASSRNYRAGAIDAISTFSSRGPTVDGRNSPTIAAPGETIASTRRIAGASACGTAIAGTGGLYSNCSGTSMAAPAVSGSAALLIEKWRETNGGATPSPAMVKALLVNGAVDIDTTRIPNNNQGWGRVRLPSSLGIGTTSFHVDQSALLQATGEVREYVVGVVDPGQPLRVTLTWTDAAGAINANPALVNNLDLEVIDGANTYRGNVFSNGLSSIGGSADTRNNVENVYLGAPGGAVTIRVRATAIQGDGVPGNGTPLDQDFALVCTNCVQEPTYTFAVTPTSTSLCAPTEGSFAIATGSVLGYADPISLGASALPIGASTSFSQNPITPGGTSTLTLGNTATVNPGAYAFSITATSTSGVQSRQIDLHVANAAADAPMLNAPLDAAGNVPALPTFAWAASAQALDYTLEVATDPAFTQIVRTVTQSATTHTLTAPLATSARYYWRVRANNACAAGTSPAAFTFTTVPAPGDCPVGAMAQTAFDDDMESGPAGWTTSALVGSTQWTQSTAQSVSPTRSWHAIDATTVTDLVLVSPSIAVPGAATAPVTLEFQHRRNIEPRSAGGCYDGGVLEVSLAGGAFTQVPAGQLLTDPYSGLINATGNPLNGRSAWCGIQPFTRAVVDLAPYAGQQAQFRFRIATDSSVGAEGWYIDDVKVKGCQPALSDIIFVHGFDM